MAKQSQPQTPDGPKGYRVKLTDVKAMVRTQSADAKTGKQALMEVEFSTKDVVSDFLFTGSRDLTWSKGLKKHLDLSTKILECPNGFVILDAAEWETLQNCLKSIPVTSRTDALIVEQVLAVEEVTLKVA